MYKIQAKTNSFLAKTPYSDPDWSPGVHDVPEGKNYFVSKVLGEANGMVQVTLGFSAGTWWVKEKDWVRVPEGDRFASAEAKDWKPQSDIDTSWVPRSDGIGGGGAETQQLPDSALQGPPQRSIQTMDQSPNCPYEDLQKASGRPQMVPYYSQRNNKVDPHTTCFSSAVAMVLAAAFPHAISDDEDYINFRVKHGLSTTAQSHLDCLRKDFLVDARFSNRQSLDWLKDRAEKGLATAVGLLHRGRLDNPTKNGGHYVVVFGRVGDDNWLVHDPFGKYNWENGTHSNESGANLVWPHEVLYHRATPAARDGHLNDLWALWIESD